jgi:NAD(P)-dependent dehydrogenase (short-subunit alcohol dehydrogenase family)
MSVVLITGSNRGLGFEFARQYAADGWQVIATCRAPNKAESLQKLKGQYPSVRIERLDVTDSDEIGVLAEKLKGVAVDVLINNAGIATGNGDPVWIDPDKNDQLFGSLDAQKWENVLRVNTIAPVMVTQALLPNIRQGKERKIAMLSSRCGSIAENMYSDYIAYSTSKAALNMAMRNIAATLRADGIILASLNPGYVKTDMGGRDADITPEESVRGMRQVIASLTQQQTGQFFRYNGDKTPW